ncbi:tryptophan biosynthesis modulator TrpM [Streptomyces sp. NPDC060000]|uniref:tryptophan biosynthesis modulator TrpM n=1 Tax=Streptomyces sp. NPDC060000 TaxID=3347031 RepID=UPI0036C0936F
MTPTTTETTTDRYARLARGCRPRGCRAPARRVHGRRVRYVIGDEPGQVNGMRWQRALQGRGAWSNSAVLPRGRDRLSTA